MLCHQECYEPIFVNSQRIEDISGLFILKLQSHNEYPLPDVLHHYIAMIIEAD
jgi:hypothetical protein